MMRRWRRQKLPSLTTRPFPKIGPSKARIIGVLL